MAADGKKIEKFGVQTAKGKRILVFRNGDKFHKGERMVVHPTKQKSMDQFLVECSSKVKLPTGAARKIVTPSGKVIKALEEIEDGEKYIACGAERLKKDLLPGAITGVDPISPKKSSRSPATAAAASSPSSSPSKPVVKAYVKGVPSKFGVQTEKGKSIYVFRNGDKHDKGTRFVVHSKKYKMMDQLLIDCTARVKVPTGSVRKLVSPKGKLVKELDELEDGGKYIACGAEKLNRAQMPVAVLGEGGTPSPARPKTGTPKASPTTRTRTTPKASPASSLTSSSTPNKPSPARKPVVKSYAEGKITKFGTQTSKGKVILVFRNGDKHHQGEKIVVHSRKFRNMDQLRKELSNVVKLTTGACRQVFTPSGKIVRELDAIEDGGLYVAAGAERLNRPMMSTHLKAKIAEAKSNPAEDAGSPNPPAKADQKAAPKTAKNEKKNGASAAKGGDNDNKPTVTQEEAKAGAAEEARTKAEEEARARAAEEEAKSKAAQEAKANAAEEEAKAKAAEDAAKEIAAEEEAKAIAKAVEEEAKAKAVEEAKAKTAAEEAKAKAAAEEAEAQAAAEEAKAKAKAAEEEAKAKAAEEAKAKAAEEEAKARTAAEEAKAKAAAEEAEEKAAEEEAKAEDTQAAEVPAAAEEDDDEDMF